MIYPEYGNKFPFQAVLGYNYRLFVYFCKKHDE